jgi:hypothetical protein
MTTLYLAREEDDFPQQMAMTGSYLAISGFCIQKNTASS